MIVPGVATDSGGGAAALGYDDQVRLIPLTVGFHETQFLSVIGEENREIEEKGFWFQRSEDEQAQSKYQWGPMNPQSLNRYAYCLGNPLRYTDPSGRGPEPPSWLQEFKVVWKNPPSWIKDILFVAGRGGRIIHINRPHGNTNFWHLNSDLRMLQGLDHANLEPLFEKLASIEAALQSVGTALTEAEWVAIVERIPVPLGIDPGLWFRHKFPELFEEAQS